MSQVYTSPGEGARIRGEGEGVKCRQGSRGDGRAPIDLNRRDGVDGETRDAGGLKPHVSTGHWPLSALVGGLKHA